MSITDIIMVVAVAAVAVVVVTSWSLPLLLLLLRLKALSDDPSAAPSIASKAGSENAMLDSLTKVGKVGLGIFVAGVVIFVVAFSVPYWVTFDTSKDRFGLWEACVPASSYTYCYSTLSDKFNVFGPLPDWFRGTQTCACFALLAIIADVVLRILFIVKKLKHYLLISTVLDAVASAFAFLGAVVFGSEVNKYSNISLNWGFAFDIIGGIFLAASAVCFFIEFCHRR